MTVEMMSSEESDAGSGSDDDDGVTSMFRGGDSYSKLGGLMQGEVWAARDSALRSRGCGTVWGAPPIMFWDFVGI